MRDYSMPDFDVIVYEIDDIITSSSPNINFGPKDPNGDDDWWG